MRPSNFRIIVLLLMFYVFGFVFFQPVSAASFSFGVAGDFGSNVNQAGKTFQKIGELKPNVFFAVGDFAYTTNFESGWCKLVKDNINIGAGLAAGNAFGETYPFQLLSGDHEAGGVTTDGFIDNYVACLPDRLGMTVGPYGKFGWGDYYYDYPPGSPNTRFIELAPNMLFQGGIQYTFTKGSTHYNWTAQTIDDARARGIKWIVILNHHNFITMGYKYDDAKADYFNLMTEKKVDLIFEGNEHNYQRSKQLAISTACPSFAAWGYQTTTPANMSCIADDGSDNNYVHGRGTILIITGTGGVNNYDLNLSDPRAAFFAKYYGNPGNPVFGFTKVDVTDQSLSVNFIRSAGATFSDSFTITDSGAPVPTPSTVASPRPTPTPTSTPRPSPSVSATPRPTPTASPGLQSDANGDGRVTVADFLIWVNNYAKLISGKSNGEFNGDAKINGLDYGVYVYELKAPSPTPTQTAPTPTPTGVTTVPSIPAGLTGTAGNGSVTLRWNANPISDGVDSYQVYEGDQNLNLAVPANQLSYTTAVNHLGTSLVNGTSYSFRVGAHNAAGYGNWTTAISVTPTSGASSTSPTPVASPVPSGSTACQKLSVPAYFYPGALWTQMNAAGGSKIYHAIMNPGNGPGTSQDSTYVSAVNAARAAGIRVMGYTYTQYGARSASIIKADIDSYKNWYGVTDIFFDEASNASGQIPYYQDLANYVHANGGQVMLNPGTVPDQGYAAFSDILLVFESSFSSYLSASFPSWMSSYPPGKFAHYVYGTSSSQVAQALSLSKQRYAGLVYITDDVLTNPWDTLPSYWSTELAGLCP